MGSDFGNPLRKFKLVFLGEQSGKLGYLPTIAVLECGDIIMYEGDRESVVQNKFFLNRFLF